jgi:type VI secretion system protein ImpK
MQQGNTMSFLNNLSSVLRQVAMPVRTTTLSGAGVAQAAGVSTAATMFDRLTANTGGSNTEAGSTPNASHGRPAWTEKQVPHMNFARPANTPFSDASEGVAPTVYRPALSRTSVLRAGQQHAQWRNPFVSAATPAILQLQEHLAQGALNQPAARAQLVLEMRLFRERLEKGGFDSSQVADASYLLCTYLDEVMSDSVRLAQQIPYDGDRSLLVEFHGDAWGGEDAFAHLEYAMQQSHPPYELLGLYEILMALGLQGRYRIRDRGDVLLQDLRSQLHAMLWQRQPDALGASLPAMASPPPRWWTASRVAIAALILMLLTYLVATLDLDARGRAIRQAIAAWEPPLHTINPIDTLPPPLPQLIDEGWLSAFKHPQGWLLVFKSDRAFAVGQAQFRPEFLNNLDRLGLALAPWPGDIEIIGHTDSQPIKSGRFPSNHGLSLARAQVVEQRMRESVIPGSARAPANTIQRQLTASGRGETEPIDGGTSAAAFERNRRVDILWKLLPQGTTRAQSDSTSINLPSPKP